MGVLKSPQQMLARVVKTCIAVCLQPPSANTNILNVTHYQTPDCVSSQRLEGKRHTFFDYCVTQGTTLHSNISCKCLHIAMLITYYSKCMGYYIPGQQGSELVCHIFPFDNTVVFGKCWNGIPTHICHLSTSNA